LGAVFCVLCVKLDFAFLADIPGPGVSFALDDDFVVLHVKVSIVVVAATFDEFKRQGCFIICPAVVGLAVMVPDEGVMRTVFVEVVRSRVFLLSSNSNEFIITCFLWGHVHAVILAAAVNLEIIRGVEDTVGTNKPQGSHSSGQNSRKLHFFFLITVVVSR
jgi:hypothetical protein